MSTLYKPRGPRRNDWLPTLGSRVYDIGDPRHVGVVQAVFHGAWVKIKWEDTGWLSEIRVARCRQYVETCGA